MPLAGVSTSVIALGLAVRNAGQNPEADIAPEQYQDMLCAALNAERARLLAERDDLNTPLLSSKTDAQREAELTRVNGKPYAIAKVQSDKSCPLVASGAPSSVVR